jgi:hypothetical protein
MHGIELNTLLCDSNNTKLKRVERKWYILQLYFGVACDYIYKVRIPGHATDFSLHNAQTGTENLGTRSGSGGHSRG